MNANYGRGSTRRRARIMRRIRRIVGVAVIAIVGFFVFQAKQRAFTSGHHTAKPKPVDVAFDESAGNAGNAGAGKSSAGVTSSTSGGATGSSSTGKSRAGFAALMFGERDIIPLDTDGHRMSDLETIFGRGSAVGAPNSGGAKR